MTFDEALAVLEIDERAGTRGAEKAYAAACERLDEGDREGRELVEDAFALLREEESWLMHRERLRNPSPRQRRAGTRRPVDTSRHVETARRRLGSSAEALPPELRRPQQPASSPAPADPFGPHSAQFTADPFQAPPPTRLRESQLRRVPRSGTPRAVEQGVVEAGAEERVRARRRTTSQHAMAALQPGSDPGLDGVLSRYVALHRGVVDEETLRMAWGSRREDALADLACQLAAQGHVGAGAGLVRLAYERMIEVPGRQHLVPPRIAVKFGLDLMAGASWTLGRRVITSVKAWRDTLDIPERAYAGATDKKVRGALSLFSVEDAGHAEMPWLQAVAAAYGHGQLTDATDACLVFADEHRRRAKKAAEAVRPLAPELADMLDDALAADVSARAAAVERRDHGQAKRVSGKSSPVGSSRLKQGAQAAHVAEDARQRDPGAAGLGNDRGGQRRVVVRLLAAALAAALVVGAVWWLERSPGGLSTPEELAAAKGTICQRAGSEACGAATALAAAVTARDCDLGALAAGKLVVALEGTAAEAKGAARVLKRALLDRCVQGGTP